MPGQGFLLRSRLGSDAGRCCCPSEPTSCLGGSFGLCCVLRGEVSAAEAARRAGVAGQAVHSWKRAFLDAGREGLAGARRRRSSREMGLEAENEEFEAALGEARVQLRVWKKGGGASDPEEWVQDPGPWRLRRFPRPFLRMLRDAVANGSMSPPTAASFAGLALPEIVSIVGQLPGEDEEEWSLIKTEFEEFEETGVI